MGGQNSTEKTGRNEDVEGRPGTDGSLRLYTGASDKILGLTKLISAESKKKKEVKKDQYDFTKVKTFISYIYFILKEVEVCEYC